MYVKCLINIIIYSTAYRDVYISGVIKCAPILKTISAVCTQTVSTSGYLGAYIDGYIQTLAQSQILVEASSGVFPSNYMLSCITHWRRFFQ